MVKILKEREIGDPILNQICLKVDLENISEETIEELNDLKNTFEFGSALGLAAPQIGINKRVIIVGAKKEDISYKDAENIEQTIMINPTWEPLSDEFDIQYEGCVSVPGIRGKVKRFNSIKLKYSDENNVQIEKKINGFFARLIQHECDHLDGICFVYKVEGPNGFSTKENIKNFNLI